MANRTCSVDGCERKHEARGLCGTHYGRWLKGVPVLRPCITCGVDIVTTSQRNYCSEDCRPTCEVDGCDKPVKTRNRCVRCYSDLLAFECTGRDRKYRWATEKKCVVCGATDWEGKRRKVCSGKCQQLLARNGGTPPAMVSACVRCGSPIDLTVLGKSGRKKRSDAKMCRWCKRSRHLRHGVSVMDLVIEHGTTDCGICGDPIDLTLKHPDLGSASIDHVTPFAHGGSNDLDNLQLSHLHCNYLKSDREGFTL